ncbi:DUF2510 domain-containing protein [Agrococcus baldri]|uniref:DUF2510 domain-containing protein n=1 Tax=Agrococcus baldri TaxID=153730 RepID=A0AA87REV3_9MICO|nr:DUF2510 domain-containing protein [Agrococcus baldri]GEK79286.1 hypothetical protein ABA31_06370 [Agrococcus baldri]
MPAFLIVHSALQDGRLDAYRQPPTLDIGGLRAPLDWGDITLHVPAGDLPVTVFVTRASGHVEGATITVRAPAGTGTRLTFVPPLQPGGRSMLRIDGQWASDSSMHYYAARDARVLAQAPPARPAAPTPPVGPMPGSTGSVPTNVSSFGREQGSLVDPVQPSAESPVQPARLAQPPHLGPHPAPAGPTHPSPPPSFGQRTAHDAPGPGPAAGRQPPPIPTPAEFHRLEQEAHDAQRRVYEAWQAQQRAQSAQRGPTPHDGAPQPVGLQANTGQAQPAWYPDPFRRAEQRWFDGRQWTASVMRGGVRGHDQPG